VHAELIISGTNHEMQVRNLQSFIDYMEIHKDLQFDEDSGFHIKIPFGIPNDLYWIPVGDGPFRSSA